MPPVQPDPPAIKRVAIDEHVAEATASIDDPETRTAIAAEARHLEPLRKVQVAFDQMVRIVEDDLRHALFHRETVELSAAAKSYIESEFDVVKRHLAALDAAAQAAHTMVDAMRDHIQEYAKATTKARDDAEERQAEAEAESEPKAKARARAVAAKAEAEARAKDDFEAEQASQKKSH